MKSAMLIVIASFRSSASSAPSSARRRFDIEVLEVVGDGERLVGLALLAHAVGPIGHGEMRPVVVALLELGPGVLQQLLPGLVAEELPERRGGDLDAVVVVRAIGRGDLQQCVAQLDQFQLEGLERLERLLVVARAGAALVAQRGGIAGRPASASARRSR